MRKTTTSDSLFYPPPADFFLRAREHRKTPCTKWDRNAMLPPINAKWKQRKKKKIRMECDHISTHTEPVAREPAGLGFLHMQNHRKMLESLTYGVALLEGPARRIPKFPDICSSHVLGTFDDDNLDVTLRTSDNFARRLQRQQTRASAVGT